MNKVGVLYQLKDSWNIGVSAGRKMDYLNTDREVTTVFLFKSSKLVTAAQFSMPTDFNTKLFRTDISFLYTVN